MWPISSQTSFSLKEKKKNNNNNGNLCKASVYDNFLNETFNNQMAVFKRKFQLINSVTRS